MADRDSLASSGQTLYFEGPLQLTDTVTFNDTATHFALEGARGGKLNFKTATASVTCSGASSDASNIIPAGSLVFGVLVRVTTAITGATGFDVGDGTTVDLWGDDVAIAANTATTLANWKAQSGTIFHPKLYTSTTSVRLTAVTANFTAGVVRVVVFYMDATAIAS
jgi:hypothetical protein